MHSRDVHRAWPDSTLTVAGFGDEETNLHALVARSGLQEFVTFPGYVPSEEFWDLADIVVQLSWWENCSYTLLDAVVQGRGVVASDVGGNAEFLPRTALVPADPGVSGVAEAILQQRNRSYTLPENWPDREAMTSADRGFLPAHSW